MTLWTEHKEIFPTLKEVSHLSYEIFTSYFISNSSKMNFIQYLSKLVQSINAVTAVEDDIW